MSTARYNEFGHAMRQLEASQKKRSAVLRDVVALGKRQPFAGVPLLAADVKPEEMEVIGAKMAQVDDLREKAKLHKDQEYADPKFHDMEAQRIQDTIAPEKLAIYLEEKGRFKDAATALVLAAGKMQDENPEDAACLFEKAAMDHALSRDLGAAGESLAKAIALSPKEADQINARVASLVKGYVNLLLDDKRKDFGYEDYDPFDPTITIISIKHLEFAAKLVEKSNPQEASDMLVWAGNLEYHWCLSPTPDSKRLYDEAARLIENINPVKAAELRDMSVKQVNLMGF